MPDTVPCDCGTCEYCIDVNRIDDQMDLANECEQANEEGWQWQ